MYSVILEHMTFEIGKDEIRLLLPRGCRLSFYYWEKKMVFTAKMLFDIHVNYEIISSQPLRLQFAINDQTCVQQSPSPFLRSISPTADVLFYAFSLVSGARTNQTANAALHTDSVSNSMV